MNGPVSIEKIKPDPDELDFDALRRAGIAVLQDLCGTIWTDFNTHDPGVTILEQLCYGLTELAYRSGFAAEDYLAEADGSIDLARHALCPPEEIFPSEAVTENDFCRVLYDQIPELEDVWMENASNAGAEQNGNATGGLVTLFLKLGDIVAGDGSSAEQTALEERVKQQAAALFARHRSLCQDIAEIKIVNTACFYLTGDIEIHSLRDPAAIYADIFFQCVHQVISGFKSQRYDDVLTEGASLEQLFTGPYTQHGYIAETRGADMRDAIPVVRLIGLIRGIEGVRQVHQLGLCDADGVPVTPKALDGNIVPRLAFPQTDAQKAFLRLHFTYNGKPRTALDPAEAALQMEKAIALVDNARIELKKMQFESNAGRHRSQTLENIVIPPRGVPRRFGEYYSIQHQFPAIYGINRYGMQSGAAPHERARVKQLKSYLFLFEQLMANYLKNIENIPQLFSVDAGLNQSYFSQRIDDDALPNIEALYAFNAKGTDTALRQISARYDPFGERRSRVLDTLLAMYGEEFVQQSLRKFNYYYHRHSHEWLIENKLAFLTHIASLSRQRAAAFHAADPAWNTDNVSGAQRKIGIMLGLHKYPGCRSFCDLLRNRGLKLVPDASVDGSALPQLHAALQGAAGNSASRGQSELQAVPESLFRKGFDAESYVVEAQGADNVVVFQARLQQQKWRLGSHARGEDAMRQIQEMRTVIRALNIACEGFHLVEHLLLRPRRQVSAEHDAVKPAQDFYAFRVSVIFPAWTARFDDREFRKLAQDTVCRNLPAHVYPEFHWLDFVPMQDFEGRYRSWLDATLALNRSASGNAAAALDAASAHLIKFLQRHRKTAEKNYWV